MQILISICNANAYHLDNELVPVLKGYFNNYTGLTEKCFANGRLVRNLYDDLVMNHAKRVAQIPNPSIQQLSYLLVEDFQTTG